MHRIAVLGSNGLLGDAICRNNDAVILRINRQSCDVKDISKLAKLLREENIDTVVNCAAVVGGIELNRKSQFDLFFENNQIALSVIQSCIKSEVQRLIQFCSNCCYPVTSTQPYKERDLFEGAPAITNLGYASAKLAAVRAGQCAEKQYGLKVFHPIPCSLFGYRDNYCQAKSHFIPAMIRKINEAVFENKSEIVFWGSGQPKREFLFADDINDAMMKIVENDRSYDPINIGSGNEIPIKEVISVISQQAGYKGRIIWDKSKPDGAMSKLLDSSEITRLGWEPKHELIESLMKTYKYFDEHKGELRL